MIRDVTEQYRKHMEPEGSTCDFCGADADSQSRDWEVEPFVLFLEEQDLFVHYSNDWLACGDCDSLLERRDEAGLLERCVKSMTGDGFSIETAQEAISLIHRAVWPRLWGRKEAGQ